MKIQENGLISIVVPTFNRAESITKCLEALLMQTYNNIEILICDDYSTDRTLKNLKTYNDKRLKIIRNKVNMGPSATRNRGISVAKGQIIFFTDDDVIVSKDWIKKGLCYFDDSQVLGIEGKIVYVSSNYRPCYSDRVVENLKGGLYMTANAAYRRKALIDYGLFDIRLRKYQDRDLALRVLQHGRIEFIVDNPVIHQQESFTVASFMFEAQKIQWWVQLYKEHNDKYRVKGIVYEPLKLLAIFVPPLVLIRLFQVRMTSKKDWLLFILIYPRLVYERLNLWRAAFQERVLVI